MTPLELAAAIALGVWFPVYVGAAVYLVVQLGARILNRWFYD